MSLTPEQWASLVYLRPSDFTHPDGLRYSIVRELDRFIGQVGSRPVILSDYRPGDERTHGQGLAIDTTWPGADPLKVHGAAMAWAGFGGVGIYTNEVGAVSFHFDTRQDTMRDYGPDQWGGIITHPLDGRTNEHVKRIEYVGANTVLDIIKKNVQPVTISLLGLAFVLWWMLSPSKK